MSEADVVIAGAGPAGAMTAFVLAKAGMQVMLLEKATFPRWKTCGGGLTHRAYRELPFNINAVIHQPVTWGYVGVNGRGYQKVQGQAPIAYLIDRRTFDDFLLQKALDQGATCHFGQRCLSLNQEEDAVTVTTDDQTYRCRYVVGADGVHSQVARQLGLLPERRTSLAHEALIIPQHNRPDPLIGSITFDFGVLISGYAWIFPKRNHLNVGVFRSWPGRRTSRKHLHRFIRKHPALSKAILKTLRAHPIPLGIRNENLHAGRALLVGDAANLVDPWLGEGLYYAFTSAKIAAEEILNHQNGMTPDLSGYSHKVQERFARQFSFARRLSLLVNTLPPLSVRMLQASTTLQEMVISLLRGEKTHEEVWRGLKRWLPEKFAEINRKE